MGNAYINIDSARDLQRYKTTKQLTEQLLKPKENLYLFKKKLHWD